jgi:hypothetical protein
MKPPSHGICHNESRFLPRFRVTFLNNTDKSVFFVLQHPSKQGYLVSLHVLWLPYLKWFPAQIWDA